MSELAALDLLEAQGRGVSDRQQEALQYYWVQVLRALGNQADVKDCLTYAGAEKLISHARTRGLAGQSIRRLVSCLKRGAKRAHREGFLVYAPVDWPVVRSDAANVQQRGKLWSPEQIKAWLACLEGEAYDEALFALLTGLRSQELKRVKREWIKQTPGGVFLDLPPEGSKTHEGRQVAISDAALVVVESCRQRSVPGGMMFSGASHNRTRRTAARNAGLNGTVTLRDLRTYYLTHAAYADAIAAQAAAGHTDLRTTQRYQRTTLARLSAASDAVSASLGAKGAQSGGHSEEKSGDGDFVESEKLNDNGDLTWCGVRDLNPRHPACKTETTLIEHLNQCDTCRLFVFQHMQMHGAEGKRGTVGGHSKKAV
jgi:integrase